jgi:hypothetical protein
MNIRSDQVRVVNLGEIDALKLTTLPDNSKVYVADLDLLDKFSLRELANPNFLAQRYTWEISNATAHFGLGNRVKRIVANSGFDVIGVRQSQVPYAKSFISVRQAAENVYLHRFAEYFNLPVKTNTDLNDRADVVFVVGEDFWEQNFQRK